MKKILLFPILFLCLFTSCRKNYVCECSNGFGDVYLHPLTAKMTKSKAQQQCDLTEVLYGDFEYQCIAKEN